MATEERIVAGVAGRYAAALFELAQEQTQIEAVEQDLVKFQGLINESQDFQRLIKSPVIPAADQQRALAAVLAAAGLGPLVQNFFKLVAQNRRLFFASEIVRGFRSLAAKARGEVTAQVASAHPLTDTQAEELKAVLKASVGKDVLLHTTVDPSLLGGLVVKIGSRMVDSSLKTKLSNLKVALKSGA